VVGVAFSNQKVAARERGELNNAERLATRLAEADAAEWQAIARQDVGSVRALHEAREQLAAAQRVVAVDAEDDSPLDAAYTKYVRALDLETQLLADRSLEQALTVDRTQVDPAYDAMREALDETAGERTMTADEASATARRMTWVVAGLGVLTLLLLLGQLVTQRRLLSRERQHLEELQGLDRLKDEFVASVSHELRTPLTSIRGYLELVLEGEAGELTPQQREFLGVIDRNSNRLLPSRSRTRS
jgi:signal transduction histidine kinase